MYRIFTEDINRSKITRILDCHFNSYTIIPAMGVWLGTTESSLVIEIHGASYEAARQTSEEIKTANQQQAVLLQHIPAESELI